MPYLYVVIPSLQLRYNEEPVKRSQMDMKRKTSYIQTSKKRLFLDIFSNVDTLVHRFTSVSKPTA
jgi:hypothetical protein